MSQGVQESGALWLGPRRLHSQVKALVFPDGDGVSASAGNWSVGPDVFATVSRWGKPQGFSLLAVVHTHLVGVPARLSRADREYSVQVPDMLSIVVGQGGDEPNHLRWGWFVYEHSQYRELSAGEMTTRILITDSEFNVNAVDSEAIRQIW